MKKKERKKGKDSTSTAQMPARVLDLMKVYEHFQESYAMTLKYLEMLSPETRQFNSDRSLIMKSGIVKQ